MRIGVDIDDVLFEFVSPFLEWQKSNVKLEDITQWDMSSVLNLEESELVRRVNLFNKSDEFKNLPPVMYAYDVLWYMKNLSIMFYAITHRPKDTKEVTCNSLEKHYPNIFEDVFFRDNEKVDIARDKDLYAHIDDGVHNFRGFDKLKTKPIVYDRPWNRWCKDYSRAKDWIEVKKNILKY
ncbi:MAG: 5' nucleotidase, NT5C type [bacterium]